MRIRSFFRTTAGLLVLLGAMTLEAQRQPSRVRVVLPAYRTPIALDTIMQHFPVDATPGAVYTAAAKAFYDLKISVDTKDSLQGVIGITHLLKSSFLAGEAMGKLLNCGMGITGPNADNFRINLALVAIITPLTPEKTELGVAFIGSGTDMRGASTDPVACAPSGVMEKLFADRVKKILKPEEPILRKPE